MPAGCVGTAGEGGGTAGEGGGTALPGTSEPGEETAKITGRHYSPAKSPIRVTPRSGTISA